MIGNGPGDLGSSVIPTPAKPTLPSQGFDDVDVKASDLILNIADPAADGDAALDGAGTDGPLSRQMKNAQDFDAYHGRPPGLGERRAGAGSAERRNPPCPGSQRHHDRRRDAASSG